MLSFERYTEDAYERETCGRVYVDPAHVASVIETTRRPPYSGIWQVAVITMVNGDKVTVVDASRTAASRIQQAREKVGC